MHTHRHTLPQGSLDVVGYSYWSLLWKFIQTDVVWIMSSSCQQVNTAGNVVSLACMLSKNHRHHPLECGVNFCWVLRLFFFFFNKPRINCLDLTVINSHSKTFSNKQVLVLQYVLVLMLNISSGNISVCGMLGAFWGKEPARSQKKIKLLWCQKAQERNREQVLERAIKVEQFKLAGFTDKWFLPL